MTDLNKIVYFLTIKKFKNKNKGINITNINLHTSELREHHLAAGKILNLLLFTKVFFSARKKQIKV